ncbi:hypothetical protein [Amnibacterium endophyticum]|uniref:Integral membrane protein n=1 Tax=Amnibacterium endophyticum TaxID=2109337 RepID=A0ABW4LC91_9MICO
MTRASTRLLFGLHASARGNAHAFGYSIGITSTYGVVSIRHPHATVWEVLAFALAGVLQFSILNLVVALLVKRRGDGPETERVSFIATATDVLAVGFAVGAATLVAFLPSPLAWPLAAFVAGLVYVGVQSVEFATARSAD